MKTNKHALLESKLSRWAYEYNSGLPLNTELKNTFKSKKK